MALRHWMVPLLALLLVGSGCSAFDSSPTCKVCGRPIHGKLSYRIWLNDGSKMDVCCPRCGLRFQRGRNDIAGVEVADFNTGQFIDASQAYFVESSKVILCCSDNKLQRDRSGGQYALHWDRCMPSLVSFKKLDEAETFRREMGGVVKDYAQLQQEPEFAVSQ